MFVKVHSVAGLTGLSQWIAHLSTGFSSALFAFQRYSIKNCVFEIVKNLKARVGLNALVTDRFCTKHTNTHTCTKYEFPRHNEREGERRHESGVKELFFSFQNVLKTIITCLNKAKLVLPEQKGEQWWLATGYLKYVRAYVISHTFSVYVLMFTVRRGRTLDKLWFDPNNITDRWTHYLGQSPVESKVFLCHMEDREKRGKKLQTCFFCWSCLLGFTPVSNMQFSNSSAYLITLNAIFCGEFEPGNQLFICINKNSICLWMNLSVVFMCEPANRSPAYFLSFGINPWLFGFSRFCGNPAHAWPKIINKGAQSVQLVLWSNKLTHESFPSIVMVFLSFLCSSIFIYL